MKDVTTHSARGFVLCKADPAHGAYVDGWCPHQSHDGRPRNHPLGPTARTSPWQADYDEPVEQARPLPPKAKE